jgi:hypothetical protein
MQAKGRMQTEAGGMQGATEVGMQEARMQAYGQSQCREGRSVMQGRVLAPSLIDRCPSSAADCLIVGARRMQEEA